MELGMALVLGIVQCYAKCYVNWILVFSILSRQDKWHKS